MASVGQAGSGTIPPPLPTEEAIALVRAGSATGMTKPRQREFTRTLDAIEAVRIATEEEIGREVHRVAEQESVPEHDRTAAGE